LLASFSISTGGSVTTEYSTYNPRELLPLDDLDGQSHDVLSTQRQLRTDRSQGLLDTAKNENRGLRASEQRSFNQNIAEITKIDRLMAESDADTRAYHAEQERRAAAAAESRRRSGSADGALESRHSGFAVRDSKIYTKSNPTFFRDLIAATVGHDFEAMGRMQQYLREPFIGFDDGREIRTNPSRVDGQGGYLVPPLWVMDEFIPALRAGRAFADNGVTKLNLPGGTDSINLPKMATGTSVNVQTADNASVASVDFTDTTVSAPVRTLAGQQDVAMQLLEQSPHQMADEIIGRDLIADYNRRLDLQCLSGSGAAGQLLGIDSLSGGVAVTYTDASPTVPELYAPIGQLLSQIASQRFEPPTAIFMHPRRWFWIMSALDTAGRPLVVPGGNGFNPIATMDGANAEGRVGTLGGLPVFSDANIGTTLGGGTEDRIYAVRQPDLYLWEGTLRLRVLQEVLSGTLQARIQAYNYVAFMPNRYAVSVGQIAGSGLAAPAGY
jgi:HK97 family phage major capsid protein